MTSFSMGSLLDRSKYFSHLTVRSNEEHTLKKQVMQIEMAMKRIILYFSPPDSKAQRIYKLNVSFSILSQILVEKAALREGHVKIYFILNSAPLMHHSELDKAAELKLKHSPNIALDISRLPWFRTTTIFCSSGSGRPSLDEHLLGMARSLCVEMENTPIALLNNLQSISNNFQEVKYFPISGSVQHQPASLDFRALCGLLDSLGLPFSIYYACRVLFGDSYSLLDALNSSSEQLDNFLDTVQEEAREDCGQNLESLEKCLYHLKTLCKDMAIAAVNVYDEFTKLLGNRNLLEDSGNCFSKSSTDYVLIRRAVLTPATLVLQPPIPLLKSRFSTMANTDYAIRLTILEDNNRKLNNGGAGKHKMETDFVQGVIRSHLLEGVKVGDRLYEFLGSSSSQMREHGVILYAKDGQGRMAQQIRDLAGDLSAFKRNVAKYVARFGLMFSQAMAIIPELPETQVKVCIMDDILGAVKPDFENVVNRKREQHILSDGVGVIDRRVVEQSVLPYLRLAGGSCSDYFPSAFQIRYGGCKGMLVAYQASVPAIVFRNSMKKYDSADSSLGILKHSLPRPVTLNRPLVNILDQMGVQRPVLYRLLEEATASVAKAALYDQAALELVRIYSTAYLPYDRLLTAGISLLAEPFLRSIVDYLISYRLNELKSKARIRIPLSCGRTAFGVVDETRTLEYGQVFFQYTKMEADGSSGQLSNETVILEGEVMVTKFPCLQPGDVRKLRAVNVKALRGIKDCIVFPSKGARPHPDEMGGSDLDGDEFAIFTTSSELLFVGPNAEPMDFPYGLAKEHQTDISMTDIVEFYTNFLLLNNIGQVACTHLAISDAHPKGLQSKDCHELALLYSISLDFQKTGVIREFPQKFFRFNLRPDFMERAGSGGHDKVYLSKRILGQFYRHCSLIERVVSLGKFESVALSPSYGKNVQLVLPGWEKYVVQAEQALLKYQLKAVEVMEQLNIAGEAVLFSDVYEDKSDASRVLVRGMFEHFQALFNEQAEKLKLSEPKERFLLASAWYTIGYEQQKSSSKQLYNGQPLLGLPWLVPEEICNLAQYSKENKDYCRGLTEAIDRLSFTDSQEVRFGFQKLKTTEVDHYYWCPVKAITAIRERYPEHLPLAYTFLESLQQTVVQRILDKFMLMLKRRVYQDSNRAVITIYGSNGRQEQEDSQLLRQIVKKKVEEIVSACGRMTSHDGFELLPTITTVLNGFWNYLFSICNGINTTINLQERTKLEELFLLKYAVYGMTFFNKLSVKLDRQFYAEFSASFENSWEVDLSLYLKGGSQGGGEDGFCSNTEYEEAFNEVFNTHLNESIKNNFLKNENVSYILPPMGIDLLNETFKNSLIKKLRILSGASEISLARYADDIIWRQMAAEGGDQADGKTVVYELKAAGIVHSTQILRLLIGHPDFFSHTWQSSFDVQFG